MTIAEFQRQNHRKFPDELFVVKTETVLEQKRNPDDAQFIVRTSSDRKFQDKEIDNPTDDENFIVRTSSVITSCQKTT